VATACNGRPVLVEPSPLLDMGSTGSRHPHHYWKENLVNIYKQGWKSIHKKYKACQSKYKHRRGKPNKSKQS